jgi:hypothetical protein
MDMKKLALLAAVIGMLGFASEVLACGIGKDSNDYSLIHSGSDVTVSGSATTTVASPAG